jgi:hypothetical protein
MWAKKIALILSMALLGAPIAFAENGEVPVPPPPTPNQPNRNMAHIDYLGGGFFHDKQKPTQAAPNDFNTAATTQGKTPLTVDETPSALHWVPGQAHPVFEFRLSNQSSVGLHISRHGTTAAAQWHF